MEIKSLEILCGLAAVAIAGSIGYATFETRKAIKILENTEKECFGAIIKKENRPAYHQTKEFQKILGENLKKNNLSDYYLTLLSA